MIHVQNLTKKANQIRKQNWSAPATMGAFIFLCMLIVFGFETLGLAKKEKNLEYRHNTTPEKIIKVVSKEILENKKNSSEEHKNFHLLNDGYECSLQMNVTAINETEKILINKLKFVSEKTREDHIQYILKILVDGAFMQNKYEKQQMFLQSDLSKLLYQNECDQINPDREFVDI